MVLINFKGKNAVWNHHLSVPYRMLNIDKKLSKKGISAEDNLIIEADNLIALKSLLPIYQGRIKCIYIDPPYNTGKEDWIYNDNSNSPLIRAWIGKVVGSDDLTRHDKWLCMMTPRLKLLRELLSNDGVIFISIDDNEIHHLRQLCDEIFGEENFEGHIHWRRRYNQPNDKTKMLGLVAEHIISYSKNKEEYKKSGVGKIGLTGKFSNPDDDPRGAWASKAWKVGSDQSGSRYKIKNPTTNEILNEEWMGDKKTYKELLEDNRIYFPNNGEGLPRKKYFKFERENEGQCATNWWSWQQFGHNQSANQDMTDLFGTKNVFSNPKPKELIKGLIQIANVKENEIVLDSFAGSGTTAHAVLDLNQEDGIERNFIVIQMNEKIDKNNPAKKVGYNYIHEITRDRINKVIDKSENNIGYTYYKLGDPIDAESLLSGKLPEYKNIAKYIFFLATGLVLEDENAINEDSFFVGSDKNRSIYLIYKKDEKELRRLAITLDWAESISKKDKKQKIVYAPACFLDEEQLNRLNIVFVGIPYNIFQRKIS